MSDFSSKFDIGIRTNIVRECSDPHPMRTILTGSVCRNANGNERSLEGSIFGKKEEVQDYRRNAGLRYEAVKKFITELVEREWR